MTKPVLPPPVIALVLLVMVFAASRAFPALKSDNAILSALGWLLVAVGLAIELVSVIGFIRARTTINPLAPQNAAALVTGGLYRFTRNPMYLGMAILMTGVCLVMGVPAGILATAVFVSLVTLVQIKPEETALAARFGDEYSAYCQRVRRWI